MSINIGRTENGPFILPDDLLTHTVAILAKKRAGKTYTAGVIEEEFAAKGLPFVVLDPVGVHYGLRSKADGKRSAYPVIVIGGEHGDVPIDRKMGTQVAEAVVEENISCIIDVSELSKTAWREFTRDFCRTLYRRNRNTTPRHVFIEEATEFIPQVRRPEMQEVYEAVERLVRMGGNRGLGVTIISQRSAQVAKDVLSQIDVLIALRTVGAHDRKALMDMFEDVLEEKDLPKALEFKKSIARLEDGTAWIWSPEYLKCFELVQIRPRTTFHAGATVMGEVQLVQAKPDVSALRKRLTPPDEEEVKGKRAVALAPCDHPAEILSQQATIEELNRTISIRDQRVEELEVEKDRMGQELLSSGKLQEALSEFLDPRFLVYRQNGEGGDTITQTPIDEDAIVKKVLAHIPQNSTTVQVTPPEVLRKKYLQQAVEKMYAQISALGKVELRAMEVLLSQDRFWSTRAVTLTGWQSDSGGQKDTVKKAIAELVKRGLATKGGSGRAETKAAIEEGVRAELLSHAPSDQEVADVVQNILSRLVA